MHAKQFCTIMNDSENQKTMVKWRIGSLAYISAADKMAKINGPMFPFRHDAANCNAEIINSIYGSGT